MDDQSTSIKYDRGSILERISASTKSLPQSDLLRLEQFAQSLVEQRKGKKAKRRSSLASRVPVDDSWKVGN